MARIHGYTNKVVEAEVFDAVEPQSKSALEKKLRKGMDFFDVVELAGVPRGQFWETDTLIHPTDGEETLRTHWEEVELADGSSKYTLQDFEFYLPTETVPYPFASNPMLHLYEGMLLDSTYHERMYRDDVLQAIRGFYRCYVSYYDEVVIIQEAKGCIEKIYRFDYYPGRPSDAYLKEHLQLGMRFPEVAEVVGWIPLGEVGESDFITRMWFMLDLINGEYLEVLFRNDKVLGFRFLEFTGEQTGIVV